MFRNDDGYGGYEGGGGGFDVSGFGATGETPQTDKKGFKRTECIIPLTVRQILDSPDTGLKIGQMEVDAQMVKLVGIVKKIARTSVKVIYTLEDNTGSIEGVHWLEADSDESFVVPVVENTYCTMVGSIRNTSAQHGQRHIMVFQIFPVTDLNEVTAHTLQIIHITLKSDDLADTQQATAARPDTSASYGGAMDSFNKGDQLSVNFNLNPTQMKVLRAVSQNCTSENGKHIDEIMQALTVKIPMRELEKTLEFLSGEGHVYSTSDDKHFKATDSFG